MSAHSSEHGVYSLATGEAAVRRLHALHHVYAPAGRRILLQAGLAPGMRVADFGCGVGAVTQMLAELVGPSGHVTGIDVSGAQVDQARQHCTAAFSCCTSRIQPRACGRCARCSSRAVSS